MNQSEKHNFEEQWRRAFSEASEPPPPAVWDKLEAQLDEQEKAGAPVVPLWWRSRRMAYVAAAAMALLLISWPLLLRMDPATPAPSVATAPAAGTPATGTPDAGTPDAGTSALPEYQPAPASPRVEPATEASPPPLSSPRTPRGLGAEGAGTMARSTQPTGPQPERREAPLREALAARSGGANAAGERLASSGTAGTGAAEPAGLPATAGAPPAGSLATARERLEVAALSPRPLRELAVYPRKRYVFYRPEETEESPVPQPAKPKEYWAGLGIMPASYNPAVSVTSPPAAFSAANAGRQSLSSSSRAGLSYALQSQGGMKLSKHWSLESGISYLQGNSTFVSDGYVLDAMTNRSTNVLENALLDGSTRLASSSDKSFSTSFANNQVAAVYIDLDQQTSNDYRFLQLPVQAGYTLNPDGKVSYTVLGGMVANLFLRNDLETTPGYTLTTTPGDGLYRTLNWSAATGVRLNYHLSSHWTASLTGSYQKAVASGIQSNSTLLSRPQLYGMGWGVRYVF
jgi:hypothetical protein